MVQPRCKSECRIGDMHSVSSNWSTAYIKLQDAQLSQRDRAAGCVIVFDKSRTLELGDNDLRTL